MIQNYIHIALMTYDYQLMIDTDYLNIVHQYYYVNAMGQCYATYPS